MPELPEVEICKRQLSPRLRGRTIRQVSIADRKIHLPPDLTGRKIIKVRRRGKYIILHLDDDRRILIHLRMTGGFVFTRPPRFRLAIRTNNCTAYFEDLRRLGKVRVVSAEQEKSILAKLGPEPLSPAFTLDVLKRTRRAVKVALLDQHLIAGVGNIYAIESLWRARIDPRRRADLLGPAELRRLKTTIVRVLREAISYGPRIYDALSFMAYGRKGQPCPRCQTPIDRIVLGGRGTYFCPRCQH